MAVGFQGGQVTLEVWRCISQGYAPSGGPREGFLLPCPASGVVIPCLVASSPPSTSTVPWLPPGGYVSKSPRLIRTYKG